MKATNLRLHVLLGLFVIIFLQHELSAISAEDAKRVKQGIAAVQSIGKAMKALEFVKWVSAVGSVVGPLLSVVTVVLDIIFGFLGIESAEMRVMKEEFKNLNIRLDAFSQQFKEVKRKIDWSAIQLSYADLESKTRVMTEERAKIAQGKTKEEKELNADIFLKKYQRSYPQVAEQLYLAMSTESQLSSNIFEAARRYTLQHPEQSFQFMKGCVQLLLQAYQIEATYIHLKYDNKMADDYYKDISTNQMKLVAKKADTLYRTMVNSFKPQLDQDVPRLALANRHLNHNQFADLFYRYISGKYLNRRWFVLVYNPISTYEKHAVSVCGGTIFFRTANRNIVVASRLKAFRSSWSEAKGNSVLGSFGEFNQYNDAAKGVMIRVMRHNSGCNPFAAIAALMNTEASLAYRAPRGRTAKATKSAYWCGDPACWRWGRRYYDTIVFG